MFKRNDLEAKNAVGYGRKNTRPSAVDVPDEHRPYAAPNGLFSLGFLELGCSLR
jgi:hypothetical protein